MLFSRCLWEICKVSMNFSSSLLRLDWSFKCIIPPKNGQQSEGECGVVDGPGLDQRAKTRLVVLAVCLRGDLSRSPSWSWSWSIRLDIAHCANIWKRLTGNIGKKDAPAPRCKILHSTSTLVPTTGGSGQREPPRLVLKVGGISTFQLCRLLIFCSVQSNQWAEKWCICSR